MPEFIPGLELCESYFREVVQPLLYDLAPDLRYAAGLIGGGSDVLGFDTGRSTDHDWGPRMTIWLEDEDHARYRDVLSRSLGESLPLTFRGFATRFRRNDDGTRCMSGDGESNEGPIEHLVDFTTLRHWFGGPGTAAGASAAWARLPDTWLPDVRHPRDDDDLPPLGPATWLTLPEQWLLEITTGRIFRDDIGDISRVRKALSWYPDDIWRYRMAAQWMRIDQLEPLVGRCGEVGDDFGSHHVAMSIAHDTMRLAFLMERRYAPYPKWFGTAFSRLNLAPRLTPDLDAIRFATTWQERHRAVIAAVTTLAHRHNTMGLTAFVDPEPRQYRERPFQVMATERFSTALMGTVTAPVVCAMPIFLGGIDQFIDSTFGLYHVGLHLAIRDWLARDR